MQPLPEAKREERLTHIVFEPTQVQTNNKVDLQILLRLSKMICYYYAQKDLINEN